MGEAEPLFCEGGERLGEQGGGQGEPTPSGKEDFWMEPRRFRAAGNCSVMPGSDPAGGSGGLALGVGPALSHLSAEAPRPIWETPAFQEWLALCCASWDWEEVSSPV